MMSDPILKENVDGEALLWAKQRAMRLDPTSWVCLLISDGAPVDDSTILANGGPKSNWYLADHLKSVVTDFSTDPRTRLGCLALDYEVEAPFRAVRKVDVLEQAPSQVFDLLDDLVWARPTPEVGNPPGGE
jgi:cobaltochelatase CobT